MSDILPCPFCGASASIEECDGGSYGVRFSVGCDSETEADCMGYQSFTTFNTRKEAVVAWNKRADATLRAELAAERELFLRVHNRLDQHRQTWHRIHDMCRPECIDVCIALKELTPHGGPVDRP